MATVEPHPKAFFRVYIPTFCEVRMQFPLLWTNDLPELVSLKDRHGNTWKLKAEKEGRCWFFTDGWIQFIYENRIDVGDLMAFYLIEDGVFRFRLFDGNDECGKIGVDGLQIQEEEEEEEEDNDEYFVEIDGFDDLSEENLPNQEKNDANRRTLKRIKIVDIYGAELIRAGKLTPVPTNPYFVTKVKPSRPSELHVPYNFLKDHVAIQLPEKLTMVDPHGRKFKSKINQWSDGRFVYSGWRKLCGMNGITPDDTCICQFVEVKEGMLMEVSFIRAGRG